MRQHPCKLKHHRETGSVAVRTVVDSFHSDAIDGVAVRAEVVETCTYHHIMVAELGIAALNIADDIARSEGVPVFECDPECVSRRKVKHLDTLGRQHLGYVFCGRLLPVRTRRTPLRVGGAERADVVTQCGSGLAVIKFLV